MSIESKCGAASFAPVLVAEGPGSVEVPFINAALAAARGADISKGGYARETVFAAVREFAYDSEGILRLPASDAAWLARATVKVAKLTGELELEAQASELERSAGQLARELDRDEVAAVLAR